MNTVTRYLRAFVGALRMTLRGEKPATQVVEERYPDLLAWCRQTVALVKGVQDSAAGADYDMATLTQHIEGRDTTLARMLEAVRYHAAQEYPHLLRHEAQFGVLAMSSTNLNDRYLVMRFAEVSNLPAPVQVALERLGEHLGNLPQAESSSPSA